MHTDSDGLKHNLGMVIQVKTNMYCACVIPYSSVNMYRLPL